LVGAAGFALAGSTVVTGRLLGSTLPPFTTVLLSLVTGLPLLAVFAAPRRLPDPRVFLRSVLQALGGVGLFRVLLLEGTKTVDGLVAGLILGLGPLLMGLGGQVFFADRLAPRAWWGLGWATAGVVLVRLEPGTQIDLWGALCLLGAVAGETAMSLLARKTRAQESADNAWWTIVAAALLSFPLAVFETITQGWPSIGPPTAWALVYYGVGPTALGYWAWSFAASRLTSATLGATATAAPVSAALLSALILGEPLGGARGAALAVVVGGLALYAHKPGPRPSSLLGRKRLPWEP